MSIGCNSSFYLFLDIVTGIFRLLYESGNVGWINVVFTLVFLWLKKRISFLPRRNYDILYSIQSIYLTWYDKIAESFEFSTPRNERTKYSNSHQGTRMENGRDHLVFDPRGRPQSRRAVITIIFTHILCPYIHTPVRTYQNRVTQNIFMW